MHACFFIRVASLFVFRMRLIFCMLLVKDVHVCPAKSQFWGALLKQAVLFQALVLALPGRCTHVASELDSAVSAALLGCFRARRLVPHVCIIEVVIGHHSATAHSKTCL